MGRNDKNRVTADSPGITVPEAVRDFSESAAEEVTSQYKREQLPDYKVAIKKAVVQETINCIDRNRFEILSRAKKRAEEILDGVKLS